MAEEHVTTRGLECLCEQIAKVRDGGQISQPLQTLVHGILMTHCSDSLGAIAKLLDWATDTMKEAGVESSPDTKVVHGYESAVAFKELLVALIDSDGFPALRDALLQSDPRTPEQKEEAKKTRKLILVPDKQIIH